MCRPPFWGSVSCTFMQLVLPSVATPGDHMASFDWLLWNQILLFEELSGGDTWRRICRGRSESVRGRASPGGGQLQERWSGLPWVILFQREEIRLARVELWFGFFGREIFGRRLKQERESSLPWEGFCSGEFRQ